jgi:ABC-2 type transport system permease protein
LAAKQRIADFDSYHTPLESMPPWLSTIMEASPSTHFVSFAQSILYRGAGIDVVWPQFLFVATVGTLFWRSPFCVLDR